MFTCTFFIVDIYSLLTIFYFSLFFNPSFLICFADRVSRGGQAGQQPLVPT